MAVSMDIGGLVELEDIAPETLRATASRIERSVNAEHFVYREAEMDELWRLVDLELQNARLARAEPGRMERLREVRGLIHGAHDTLGQTENVMQASMLLRAAADLIQRL